MEKKPDKKHNDLQYKAMAVLLGFWVPLPIAGPVGLVLYIIHLGESGNLFLILTIITAVLYLVASVMISLYFIKGLYSKPDLSKVSDISAPETGPSPSSAFFLGMLGGALLDRTIRKEKHNDFLWQDETRRKMSP